MSSSPSPKPPQAIAPFTPVALRPRHDGWTAERQIKFVQALADTGNAEQAARSVGMTYHSARALYRREGAGEFRGAWDAAIDCRMPVLEHAVLDRTINGVPRPIFYKGEQVGEWRHFDERLAMFMLRNRRDDRYGKWVEAAPPPPSPSPAAPSWHDQRAPGNPAAKLEGHLVGIEYQTPHDDGFEVEWPQDDQPAPPSPDRMQAQPGKAAE